jgi:hypothetical protein
MSAGLRSGSAQPVGFSNTNSRVQNSLASSKWISGTRLGTKKVIYWTPCFWNSCPDGEYTFDIQATCEFTVYLVDEWGQYCRHNWKWVWMVASFLHVQDHMRKTPNKNSSELPLRMRSCSVQPLPRPIKLLQMP